MTLALQLEGLLYALGRQLSRADAARLLNAKQSEIDDALQLLTQAGRGVIVVDDGRQLELRVSPEAAAPVEAAQDAEYARDIGKAGLEVVAAILYRGPLTRAEIDFIRGVNSSQTLRALSMRGLVRRVTNPKDERSFVYEPTTELLATLGVAKTADLPDYVATREKLLALEHAYRSQQTES